MRPVNDDYDEYDEFDEIGYDGVQAKRRMINDRHGRRRRGSTGKSIWDDDVWGQYDDYDDNDYSDYGEEKIDKYSQLTIDHH